jgi:mRNA interferase RelE/StbE
MYRLDLSPAARRDLDKLERRISSSEYERLSLSIYGLAREPRPRGANKVKSKEGSLRIRVGSFRVLYRVHDGKQLVVLARVLRRNETTYR